MRRPFATCWFALLALGLALGGVRAQDYPTRPIRLIVGFPPGGVLDLAGRVVGQKLGDLLGQQIVIENRSGASGIIGAQAVAQAAPDGYTLFLAPGDIITVPSLTPPADFDPVKRLLPIASISENPLAIVTASKAPFSTVRELVNAANARPHGLTYATPGIASTNNIAGLWLAQAAHIKLVPVPYRGGAEAALAVAAGDVALGIFSPPAIYSLVNSGHLKVIALSGARPAFLPSTWPTLAENGLPINVTIWIAIFAPAGTPAAIVARLQHGIQAAVQDESVRKRMSQAGTEAKYIDHAALAERIRSDSARFEQIIRQSGLDGKQ
jgi:tripartite-type tricarboxylate transporter receptor subunit TctC